MSLPHSALQKPRHPSDCADYFPIVPIVFECREDHEGVPAGEGSSWPSDSPAFCQLPAASSGSLSLQLMKAPGKSLSQAERVGKRLPCCPRQLPVEGGDRAQPCL